MWQLAGHSCVEVGATDKAHEYKCIRHVASCEVQLYS